MYLKRFFQSTAAVLCLLLLTDSTGAQPNSFPPSNVDNGNGFSVDDSGFTNSDVTSQGNVSVNNPQPTSGSQLDSAAAAAAGPDTSLPPSPPSPSSQGPSSVSNVGYSSPPSGGPSTASTPTPPSFSSNSETATLPSGPSTPAASNSVNPVLSDSSNAAASQSQPFGRRDGLVSQSLSPNLAGIGSVSTSDIGASSVSSVVPSCAFPVRQVPSGVNIIVISPLSVAVTGIVYHAHVLTGEAPYPRGNPVHDNQWIFNFPMDRLSNNLFQFVYTQGNGMNYQSDTDAVQWFLTIYSADGQCETPAELYWGQ